MHTPPEESDEFAQVDRLCAMAASLLGASFVAFVRTVDALSVQNPYQFRGAEDNPDLLDTLRGLCSPALPLSVTVIVPLADPSMKAFAGVSLSNPAGEIVGCLCAVSLLPRLWSERDLEILATVRGLVLLALELHDTANQKQRNAQAAFIAEVVHDLRQPLALIAISGELLALAGAQKIAAHCETVKKAVGNMKLMIDGLMDVPSSLPFQAIRQSINPAALIAEMVRDLAPVAAQRGLTIESTVLAQLPAIYCDPAQIQRVFSNLLGNAIKFATPSTVIRITSQINAGGVDFSVTNEGDGIAEADVAHVFERCWQSSLHADGRGLGLAIVEKIMKEQGGSIIARSLAGITSFCLTLPSMASALIVSPVLEVEMQAA